MTIRLFLILTLSFILTEVYTQVNWMSLEEAIEKSKTEKKKIFIDVYTDWCGWCKVMDKKTFNTEDVSEVLNRDYYPVKFNAEQKNTINFNNKEWKYIRSGRRGYHELAAKLLDGQRSYPSVVFLDENYKLIQAIPGYRKKDEFLRIANYFGQDLHKKMSWENYNTNQNQVANKKKARQPMLAPALTPQ